MENAAKALIMAGAVLLTILVLSLMNYLFKNMAEGSADVYGQLEESDILEFNQKFLNYNGRGTEFDGEGNPINPLNVQDVVTIINIAKDNNESKKFPITVTVTVIDGANREEWQSKTASELNKILKDNIDCKYSCSVEYATNSKLVGNINITKLD